MRADHVVLQARRFRFELNSVLKELFWLPMEKSAEGRG